jgi:hypothetical protein
MTKKARHDGSTNAYSFKVNDKTFILRTMTPSQVTANNAKAFARAQETITNNEMRGERVTHQNESECHKPQMSGKMMSVLLATKCELRGTQENPYTIPHHVRKDKEPPSETNEFTFPLSLMFILKECQDEYHDDLHHGARYKAWRNAPTSSRTILNTNLMILLRRDETRHLPCPPHTTIEPR